LRREAFPGEWVFPAPTKSGHIESSSIAGQHTKACTLGKLGHFPLYTFRHTCLTRWAPHIDPWTLAYLADHSNMATTKRYVHPQLENTRLAIERAREAQSKHTSGHSLNGPSLSNLPNPTVTH
jgi:integrase